MKPVKTPQELGMPEKFREWNPGQEDIIAEVQGAEVRFVGQIVPTGGGKTVCYMASAYINRKRTIILTATKGLQDQLQRDFGDAVAVVKGRSAYMCRMSPYSCQFGPCLAGVSCEFAKEDVGGCPYHAAIRAAREAKIVVPNYTFWVTNEPDILGEFSFMVCDEAHDLDMILLDSQSFSISQEEVVRFCVWPPPEKSFGYYQEWAKVLRKLVDEEIANLRVDKSNAKEVTELVNLTRRLSKIENARAKDYTIEHLGDKLTFDLVWLKGDIVETHLFRGIPRVLFTSATLDEECLTSLGLRKGSYTLTEYPSTFPTIRRPVTFLPTVKMDRNTTNEGMNLWLGTIDNIIRTRCHLKGIIHTVSYARARQIIASSCYRDIMISHGSRDLQEVVAKFKGADYPCILVSPSIVTGYDFPDDECRWQIIGKIPFPDTRSKVAQARDNIDPSFYLHKTLLAVIQACGRGMRNRNDFCETIILDAHWMWFRRKYRNYIPTWFAEAMRDVRTIPDALEFN